MNGLARNSLLECRQPKLEFYEYEEDCYKYEPDCKNCKKSLYNIDETGECYLCSQGYSNKFESKEVE